MNTLSLLAAAPTRLDPVELFLAADIVVQSVMAGLVLASIWVWAIILSFGFRMAAIRKRSEAYERDFWKASDVDAFQAERGGKEAGELPVARVVAAGLAEWRRSTGRFGRAVRWLVRHGLGDHELVLPDRHAAEFIAGGGCARDFGGAVRHGDWPVCGDPGSDCLQPLFPPGEPA